jgi:hypothetical protein
MTFNMGLKTLNSPLIDAEQARLGGECMVQIEIRVSLQFSISSITLSLMSRKAQKICSVHSRRTIYSVLLIILYVTT